MALEHSPADVIRQLLINLGLGVDVGVSGWQVYSKNEPNAPDNVITVYATEGRNTGRYFDGVRAEHYGISVRIRSAVEALGDAKAWAIADMFDQNGWSIITLNSVDYCIQTVTRTSGVIPLGKESTSNRRIFTLNALVAMIKT